MNDTVIEKLPKDVLKTRAQAHGRSLEDEISGVLQGLFHPEDVTPVSPLKTRAELEEILKGVELRLLAANGGRMPKGVVDAFIAERRIETLKEEIKYSESVAEMAERA